MRLLQLDEIKTHGTLVKSLEDLNYFVQNEFSKFGFKSCILFNL